MARILLIGRSHTFAATLAADPILRDRGILRCGGNVDAIQRLRERAADVVLTDPDASIEEDLALARELTGIQPGVRVIILAPSATGRDVIDALTVHAFACFTAPFQESEIADMVRLALRTPEWRNSIQVLSGLPHWLTLRVTCRLVTAERLMSFMTEFEQSVAGDQRELLMTAFRELLLNAMEHGAGFDAEKVIEVTAARTARAIVYHFRDPGDGFDSDDLDHAARSCSADDIIATALRRAELGLRPGGFGMLIARQVADELVYNERRNEVLMIKHLA